jgi:pimeloyl-ACP methyl ester carboxylesterase
MIARDSVRSREVGVPVGAAVLAGDLVVPEDAVGIVVFAHGSGSGRHSARNRAVAARLNEKRIGTLLLDLLTPAEERVDLLTREHRFDIDLLARRLIATLDWLRDAAPEPELEGAAPAIGLFGASTGAAAALIAAAERPDDVAAIVSRGGRVDLAGSALTHVRAPTLLIVGDADEPVLAVNRRGLELLRAEKRLVVVPGASHLFEEPGTLEQVARLAAEWFSRHLSRLDAAR